MIKRYIYIFIFIVFSKSVDAACPQIYDYLGNLSSRPYWISCSGAASYNLNFQSNTSWGAYTIDFGDGSPLHVGASYIAGTIINHTYAPTIDTFIVTLTIPSSGCVLTGVVVMENPVSAAILIPLLGVTKACAPATLAFKNGSTNVSKTTKFTWNFGDGTPTIAFSYTNSGQTINHTYNKGTVSCETTVTLTAQNYCTPSPTKSEYFPIQIYDLDDAAIAPDAFVKCFPSTTFTFNNTTNRNCLAQGNTFQREEKWHFGNYWGLGHDSIIGWNPWPPTSPRVITYPGVGSYQVMLVDSNFCGRDTQRINVTIINPPSAGVIAPAGPNCQGVSITFTNASAPGYSYKWNFGEGGGFVSKPAGPQSYSYVGFGSFTVSVVALVPGGGSSCTDTATVVVNILPRPTANFTVVPNQGCNSISGAVFTDNSLGAVAWSWNFGNGNTFVGLLPPPQNYTAVGNYVASLTVTALNTCMHTFTAPINVYPKPKALFSPTAACAGAVASFTDNSTFGASDPITSWNWDFGDASPTYSSSVQNPNHTYTLVGTYTVQLIVNTAHCQDTLLQNITINVKPTANFTMTPIIGCPTLTVNFTNTSVSASTYNWAFGDGSVSTATNPANAYTNTLSVNKDYTVTLTAVTGLGCSDTKTAVVTVYPKPVASFTVVAPLGCSPIVATFTNGTTGATSYTWSYGDGSSSSSGVAVTTHTYVNPGLLLKTYTVQLLAKSVNGCIDSVSATVTVYPKPIFGFTMVPNSGCSPLSINFPPVLGAVSYTWNFGDGSPVSSLPNPIHTFTNSGTTDLTYTVQLIATNAFGCSDTTYGSPVVFGNARANFALTPTVGCSPLLVSSANTSTNAASYLWKFGDGTFSAATIPNHIYTNPSNSSNLTFNCTLVAITSKGCRDSLTSPVLVLYKPKADFTVDTPSCSPKLLTFTNSSIGASTYLWDFGASTFTTTNVSKALVNNTGSNIISIVQLIATSTDNCKDTLKVPIVVHPKPEFTIVALPDSGCTALHVDFPDIPGVKSYQWSFGDGTSSNVGNTSNLYYNNTTVNKTFTVQLIASDNYGCKDTSYKQIKVFAKPVALFQANPNTVFVPTSPVNCTNLSSGAISYYWNFGDGSNSTDTDPVHYYQNIGEYQITLIATNAKGCKDTFELPSKIIALLESSFEIPNAFSPNPLGSNGGSYGKHDTNNDVFHPNITGVDKYELNIFSRWGELLFVSKDVNIGWDGYYKGKLCTQDVYVWKIIASTIDGKKINKTGDVLLLR